MHEQSIAEIDFDALTKDRSFHDSPDNWEDQVLYFLLLDRFSDGNEKGYLDNSGKHVRGGATPRFDPKKDRNSAVTTPKDAREWREAGDDWVGGTLVGMTSKLGYLKRLGITAVWISPILKQCVYSMHTYHGYGTQNFLEVDPHFGTREDLRELVDTAHKMGIRVILDVILNHAGDVFEYAPDRYEEKASRGKTYMDARWDGGEYPVKAFRDAKGKATLPFGPIDLEEFTKAWPDAAIWPRELQDPSSFNRKGHIVSWDNFPEYVEADFYNLKDLNLGSGEGDDFQPSSALHALCAAYKFWIGYADLDGLRVDTVKHMGIWAARHFAREIHTYAKSLGKKNFYLIGEIAGGRINALNTLRDTEMDAALGVDEIPMRIRDLVAGRCPASEYFELFDGTSKSRNVEKDSDTIWKGTDIVTFFDDHDQIGRPVKGRLAAEYGSDRVRAERAVIAACGINLTTTGIPCLYYGTEQALDGHAIDEKGDNRYTREAMFGGAFGPFASRDRHVFDEKSHVFVAVSALTALRAERDALRRGKQYLREVQRDGAETFVYPLAQENCDQYAGLVAWSRIQDHEEIVCVLNTDQDNPQSAWVTVDSRLHKPGSKPLKCLYSTDPDQIGSATGSPEPMNGSAVCITLPAGGFAIFG